MNRKFTKSKRIYTTDIGMFIIITCQTSEALAESHKEIRVPITLQNYEDAFANATY